MKDGDKEFPDPVFTNTGGRVGKELNDEELAEIQFIREYMEMHKDFYEKNKHPLVIQ